MHDDRFAMQTKSHIDVADRASRPHELFFLMHGPDCDGKLAGVVYGCFDRSQAAASIDAQPRSF